jgi:dTDP-4-dehydrorhamnose reductase
VSASVILITGASGLLAPFSIEACQNMGDIITTSTSSGDLQCDLADTDSTKRLIDKTTPDIVIHGAAMTDVDGCERDPQAADRNNHLATLNIANSLPADCKLVYISTDQVYPNTTGPHREDNGNPVNAYGRSKLSGEIATLKHPRGVALRTSFFGNSRTGGRKSLSDFIVESLGNKREITLFDDVMFSPLHVETLAQLISEIAASNLTGAYNICSRDGLSKANFALEVARHLGLQTKTATIGKSISQPDRAMRTLDLRMDPAKLESALNRQMPTLQQEIEKL